MNHFKSILLALILGFVSVTGWASPIDINTATAEQFASTMKGVGPNKAQAIVQHRAQHGPFKHIEELTQVRGIGKKTIEVNRTVITVHVGDSSSSSQSTQ